MTSSPAGIADREWVAITQAGRENPIDVTEGPSGPIGIAVIQRYR
jgi:hypothetical protein